MFTLMLVLLIVGLSLGALLFVGGLYVQGYIYTEPSPHLTWGAPAAAALMFGFYSAWCLGVAYSAPSDSPYHIIWQFSPTSNQFPSPVKELWAVRKGDKKERYVLKKSVMFAGQSRSGYRSADTDKPWSDTGVEAIILRNDGADVRYDLTTPDDKKRQQGAYRQYVSSDGWAIRETEDGPADNPEKPRFGRMILFLTLHALHLGLWFVCLWLLMRFQWFHALVTAGVLWIGCSLILLPMLVGQAVDVSVARHAPAARVQGGS